MSRMTLRVSRDSGRTWGPTHVVEEHPPDPRVLPDSWFKLPPELEPCECPRCRVRPVRLDAPLTRLDVVVYCGSLSALVIALLVGIGTGR
ncbi:hypothetical protein [Streptomyces daliensis]